MVSKYGHNRQGIEMLVPRAFSSNIWQGIMSSASILMADSRCCVEDERNTYFWLDTWVLSVPLITLSIQLISYNIKYTLVSSYWKDGPWVFDEPSNYLPLEVLQALNPICLREDVNDSDRLGWSFTLSGSFSICSAYSWLLSDLGDVENSI